jgi:hypothetical protein
MTPLSNCNTATLWQLAWEMGPPYLVLLGPIGGPGKHTAASAHLRSIGAESGKKR